MSGAAARIEAAIAGARRISSSTFPELLLVESKEHWERLQSHVLFPPRRRAEDSVISLPLPNRIAGFCSGCGKDQKLEFTARHALITPDGGLHLALSETGVCPACRISSRMRFALDVVGHRLRSGSVYITEQTTNLFRCIERINPNVIGSEYLGDSISGGAVRDGIRHEDLQNLSLPSASVDLVICLDVLEHVNDPVRAVGEINRALKPGGLAVVTFPFFPNRETTTRRAIVSADGQVQHLLPPEHHGNPLGGGALVFSELSWDFLDECRQRGVRIDMIHYWSLYRGHFDHHRFACLITK